MFDIRALRIVTDSTVASAIRPPNLDSLSPRSSRVEGDFELGLVP